MDGQRKQATDVPFDLAAFEAELGPLPEQIAHATTPRWLCALLLLRGGMTDEEIHAELVRRFAGPDGAVRKTTGAPITVEHVDHWRDRLNQGRFQSIGRTNISPVTKDSRPAPSLPPVAAEGPPAARLRTGGLSVIGPRTRAEIDEYIVSLLEALQDVHNELCVEVRRVSQATQYPAAHDLLRQAEEVMGLIGQAAGMQESWTKIVRR